MSKSTKIEAKRLAELDRQLQLREKKVSDHELKLRKQKTSIESDKKKLATERKTFNNEKKKWEQTNKAAAAQTNKRKSTGGSKTAGARAIKLETELAETKKKLEHFSKDAREYKKKSDAYADKIKVLERKLKNAQSGGKKRPDDRRLKNALRENKMLKKKLRALIKELNKQKRWWDRVIIKWQANQDRWIKKQQDAFRDKKILIKYVTIPRDLRKVSVYRRGKDSTKFKRRVRMRAKGGGEVVYTDVEVAFADDDDDSDDDDAAAATGKGGKAGKGGKSTKAGAKKGGKKKKKNKSAEEEEELEAYMADLFKDEDLSKSGDEEEKEEDSSEDESSDDEDLDEDEDHDEEASDHAVESDDKSDAGLSGGDEKALKALVDEMTNRNGDLHALNLLFESSTVTMEQKPTDPLLTSADDEAKPSEDADADKDADEVMDMLSMRVVDEEAKTEEEPDEKADTAADAVADSSEDLEPAEQLANMFEDIRNRHEQLESNMGGAGKSGVIAQLNKQYMDLLEEVAKSKQDKAKLRTMCTCFTKELEGRIADLLTLNRVYFDDPNGEVKLDESEEKPERSVSMAEVSAKCVKRHDWMRDVMTRNDASESLKMIANELFSNNDDWRKHITDSTTFFNDCETQKSNLTGQILTRYDELRTMIELVNALPTTRLDLEPAPEEAEQVSDEREEEEEEEEEEPEEQVEEDDSE